MVHIRLDRAERNVLEQISTGNHTITDLVTATGFPRDRLMIYLDRLERDDFVSLNWDDSDPAGPWITLTPAGIERSQQPDTRHPLSYV